jgi:hypothetical protein
MLNLAEIEVNKMGINELLNELEYNKVYTICSESKKLYQLYRETPHDIVKISKPVRNIDLPLSKELQLYHLSLCSCMSGKGCNLYKEE